MRRDPVHNRVQIGKAAAGHRAPRAGTETGAGPLSNGILADVRSPSLVLTRLCPGCCYSLFVGLQFTGRPTVQDGRNTPTVTQTCGGGHVLVTRAQQKMTETTPTMVVVHPSTSLVSLCSRMKHPSPHSTQPQPRHPHFVAAEQRCCRGALTRVWALDSPTDIDMPQMRRLLPRLPSPNPPHHPHLPPPTNAISSLWDGVSASATSTIA